MVNYPISRLLLSIQNPPSSPPPPPAVPRYSDIVIILTCLLCSLICVVGLMALVRWSCFKPPTSATTDEGGPSEGFKKKVVDELPRLMFKSAADVTVSTTASASAAECVICLSEFLDGQEIRVLPKCGHVFHVGCIDKWLIGSHSFCCPFCRQVLVISQCQKCKTDVSVSSASATRQLEPDFLP